MTARQAGPNDGGVSAIIGATYEVFGDRLPKEYRDAAWSQAYDPYQPFWRAQGPIVDQFPPHPRGELLGGLAASAIRTGRTEEAMRHLDKILAGPANTPYEPVAKK